MIRIVHLYSGNLYGGIERALAGFAAAEYADRSSTADYAEYADRSSTGEYADHAEHADRPAQLFALAFDGRLRRELTSAGADVVLLGEVRGRAPWTIWRARRRLAARLAPRNTRIDAQPRNTLIDAQPRNTRNTRVDAQPRNTRIDAQPRNTPNTRNTRNTPGHLTRETTTVAVAHSMWALAVLGPAAREAGALIALYLHNPPTAALWPDGWARRTPVDVVIANSRYTAAASRAVVPASMPIECVYPPLSDAGPRSGAALVDRQAVRTRVRRELDTSDRDVVVVQASRLEAWKGHAALIEALAAMRNQPGWTAWIAGGAQRARERRYLAGLRTAIADAGLAARVRFAGDREDIGALLASADIYCQPNRDPEPFGLAFVEALAAGLPVVATAAGGAVEIVTDDCGRLVRAGDGAALTGALRALVGDASLRAALGGRGPARARMLCDPAAQLQRLTAVLSRAAVVA